MFKNIMKIVVLFHLSLFAQEKMAHNSFQSILNDIQKNIQELSQIATKIKENEPYQPYIISVFRGEELERLGVSNLKEALELIPGIDIATDNMDNKTAIFRGSNPFAFGQSKLIIDGVCVNNIMFDAYGEFLYMPIELIKRIEVVRGPGSRAKGINAYAGSIRVFTYAERLEDLKRKDRLFLKSGSYDYRGFGFMKDISSGDWDILADFYYQRDDKFLPTGYDMLVTGVLGDYNRQFTQNGEAPLWMRNGALGVTITHKNWTIRTRDLFMKRGSAYGINYMLARPSDSTKFLNGFLEVAYANKLNGFQVESKFGIKYDQFYSDARLAPPGIALPNPLDNDRVVIYTNGFYGLHQSNQMGLYHSLFIDKEYGKHHYTLGYILSREKTYKVITKTTDRFNKIDGLVDYSDTYPFFDKHAKRDSFVFALQDDYEMGEDMTLSLGINIDKSSFLDTQFNPRVAAVYIDKERIYKLIYSRSIRKPSWQEMFTLNNHARIGNRYLKPEVVDAYEAAFIQKFSIDRMLQFNLFYLNNRNQIDNLNSDHQYRNSKESDIYGMEVEYKSNIGKNGTFFGTYSYVNGNNRGCNHLANVAQHMVKGFVSYQITSYLQSTLIGKYVGKKRRLNCDERGDLKRYTTFDIGLSYLNPSKKFSLRIVIKNIFDADIRYPSPPDTYMDDYQQEGRNFMITLKKEF